jgi:glutamate racemase
LIERPLHNRQIGIFDSGLGGLAVFREVRKELPNEDVLYLGDTARQPYGPRTVDEVRDFSIEITGWLENQGVKLVIIACNSASVAGLDAVQEEFPNIPIIGMLEPAVNKCREVSSNQRIGVWGTAVTIENRAYDKLIHQFMPKAYVEGVACPQLLRLAEKGLTDDKDHLIELVENYYSPFEEGEIDTLILGCTDFTCVRHIIDIVVPEKIKIIDPAIEVALESQRMLSSKNLIKKSTANPNYLFKITGTDIRDFSQFAVKFLGLTDINVERINLEEIHYQDS